MSAGELEMTFNTSEVAICCSSDSRSSLSRRAFSMAMTAWEILYQFDLFVGEGPHFLAIDSDCTNQHIALKHRCANGGSRAAEPRCSTWDSFSSEVTGMAHLLCRQDAFEETARRWLKRTAAV